MNEPNVRVKLKNNYASRHGNCRAGATIGLPPKIAQQLCDGGHATCVGKPPWRQESKPAPQSKPEPPVHTQDDRGSVDGDDAGKNAPRGSKPSRQQKP